MFFSVLDIRKNIFSFVRVTIESTLALLWMEISISV